MQLAALSVENFRGVHEARLELDATTVLVGENRVGKTTLVDAIDYCLRPSRQVAECPFVPSDLRRVPNGEPPPPIRIILEFQEDERGEWAAPSYAHLLALMLSQGPKTKRRLRLCLMGRRVPDSATEIESEWSFLDEEDRPHPGRWTLGHVSTLRRLAPCLVLARDRWDLRPTTAAPPGPRDTQPHVRTLDPRQEIAGVYRRACQTRGGLSRTEVLAGLAAARRIDAQEQQQEPARVETPRDVRDMIEAPRDLTPLPQTPDEDSSLSAQNLALLLLVGALLDARGDWAIPPDASPIVVIEDPEAHLHPILSASLWGTLERLRAQKVITTHSGNLLAAAPLHAVRRVTRRDDTTRVHQLSDKGLSLDDLRRVAYHVRMMRGASLFARCWLLVEGETEAWLLPELARQCGFVLTSEGVTCIEFAQCGVRPLVKLATELGIEWHLLADGDRAGQQYVESAKRYLAGRPEAERITCLEDRDVEHCLWFNGYADVFRRASTKQKRKRGRKRNKPSGQRPKDYIRRAMRKHSKPFMALRVIEAAAAEGSPGVPQPLRRAVAAAVWLARQAAGVRGERPEL